MFEEKYMCFHVSSFIAIELLQHDSIDSILSEVKSKGLNKYS